MPTTGERSSTGISGSRGFRAEVALWPLADGLSAAHDPLLPSHRTRWPLGHFPASDVHGRSWKDTGGSELHQQLAYLAKA